MFLDNQPDPGRKDALRRRVGLQTEPNILSDLLANISSTADFQDYLNSLPESRPEGEGLFNPDAVIDQSQTIERLPQPPQPFPGPAPHPMDESVDPIQAIIQMLMARNQGARQ